MEKVELVTNDHVYFDGPEGEILVGPSAVFWHRPGERTVHRYPPGTSYECLCVNFVSEAKPKRQVPRHTRWDDVPSAQAFAREIIDCDTVGQLNDPTFGAYVFYRLFWNAMAHNTRTRHPGPSHLVDACAFIRANIAEDLTVEHIAKTIGISGPHLHHLLRLHLARTPHGFILEERFQRACKLFARHPAAKQGDRLPLRVPGRGAVLAHLPAAGGLFTPRIPTAVRADPAGPARGQPGGFTRRFLADRPSRGGAGFHLPRCPALPEHAFPAAPMIRKAFVMSVHAGSEEEYERRHRPIWAELEETLRAHGVHNYSIFLHPGTRQLFGYVEIEDEARWASIAETAVCKKWWAHMGDVMPSHPDNSPVSAELREVFHLD